VQHIPASVIPAGRLRYRRLTTWEMMPTIANPVERNDCAW
jgi:hypothetical protein